MLESQNGCRVRNAGNQMSNAGARSRQDFNQQLAINSRGQGLLQSSILAINDARRPTIVANDHPLLVVKPILAKTIRRNDWEHIWCRIN